jgi:hypothetical protein
MANLGGALGLCGVADAHGGQSGVERHERVLLGMPVVGQIGGAGRGSRQADLGLGLGIALDGTPRVGVLVAGVAEALAVQQDALGCGRDRWLGVRCCLTVGDGEDLWGEQLAEALDALQGGTAVGPGLTSPPALWMSMAVTGVS